MLLNSLLVMFVSAASVIMTAYLMARRSDGHATDLPKGVEMAIGAISGLFVFSFAFLAVNAQSELAAARKATLAEASALKDAYFAAQGLPAGDRDSVRHDLAAYTRSVVSAEWPAMSEGRADPATVRRLDGVRSQVYRSVSRDSDTRAAKAEVSQRLREVYVAPRERLAEKDAQVPLPILSLMIGAGLATLAVIALFGRPVTKVHYALLGFGAAGFGYMIYLVLALNHPYSGGVSVGPDAYGEALQRYPELMR
ncbi:hypothetical protein [Streptomyces melanogenes]|uniref:bestrophin-like domain n=1 Tax=Streptomyces melanogenes TaxID=67326 RepID=UPI0037A6516E